jgi:hypothetical protein
MDRAVDQRITGRLDLYARVLYRELAGLVDQDVSSDDHAAYRRWVLGSVAETFDRLLDDRDIQNPERLLVRQVSHCFSLATLPRAVLAINETIAAAIDFLESPQARALLTGQCRATTKDGKQCQRPPVTGEDYCPSHRHLARLAPVRGVARRHAEPAYA